MCVCIDYLLLARESVFLNSSDISLGICYIPTPLALAVGMGRGSDAYIRDIVPIRTIVLRTERTLNFEL